MSGVDLLKLMNHNNSENHKESVPLEGKCQLTGQPFILKETDEDTFLAFSYTVTWIVSKFACKITAKK
jgi:hypothetical protein